MGKLIPLLFAGAGTATISVGGFYLLGGNGTSNKGALTNANDQSSASANSESVTAPTLAFNDLTSFKSAAVSSVSCIGDFNGLAGLQGNADSVKTIDGSANKIESTFVGTNDTTNVSKGCLIVNWEKKEYSNDKWNGNFKLLWTFKKNDKGFISFVVAKEKEAKKLGLTGIFYALSKTGGNWSITHKKEVSTQKEIYKNGSQLEQNFPKAGTGLTDLNGQSWWKMFSSQDDLENICVSAGNDCTSPSRTKTLRGYWIWAGSSTLQTKLDGGIGNLSDWWNNVYVNNEIDIPTIASAEKGSWNRVDIAEATTPST